MMGYLGINAEVVHPRIFKCVSVGEIPIHNS
jgi:hypothetical protein